MFHPRIAASRPRGGPRCQVEPLEGRLLFAAGDPDPSFGAGGTAVANFGLGGDTTTRDVAVQADGKTVVVAELSVGKFAVARFNVDGTPDATFGPGHTGQVVTTFPTKAHSRAVALQPDGKIVVAGEALRGNDQYYPNYLESFAVVRYNPDGSLDTTFDGDGIKTFTFGDDERGSSASDVAVQLDGKIVIGGTAIYWVPDGTQHSDDSDFAFARLNPDGSFDASFDGDGRKTLRSDGNESFSDMAVDENGTVASNPNYGKIVAVGTTRSLPSGAVAVRLGKDGQPDTLFSDDGWVRFGFYLDTAAAVLVQPSGKIVIAGSNSNGLDPSRYTLARLLAAGQLDPTFGPSGTGFSVVDRAQNYTLDEKATDLISPYDGGLIMGGVLSWSDAYNGYYSTNEFLSFTADGLPDTRFGANGRFGTGSPQGVFGKLAYGPGKRFVFAGGTGAARATRFLDAGGNLVYATSLSPFPSESGPTARSFVVFRQERLPYATRVYFSVGGAATPPTALNFRTRDYTLDGMVFPNELLGESGPPYVDIPANATFATVLLTPVDDTRVEGNETAVFTILPDPASSIAYDVGTPGAVTFVITDNDAPPPSVQQVYVRGSSWKGADGDDTSLNFKEYLAANALGDAQYGYRVDNLPAGATLPWTNADQVVLRYDYPPTGAAIPVPGGVTLHGARSDYAVTAVEPVDPRTFVLTLDRPLGALPAALGGGSDGDRVTLSVPGGAAGATYALALSPLPGDADRAGGRVSALDLGFVKARSNRTAAEVPPATSPYTPFADVNGDGRINALDLGSVKARANDSLPGASVTAASAAFADHRTRPAGRSVLASILA